MKTSSDLLAALLHAVDGQEWRGSALCGQTDPDDQLWFPGQGTRGLGTARRICARCDVTEQCLTYALEHNENHGVWGGYTAAERRRMRKPADTIATDVDVWIAATAEPAA